MAVKGRVGPVVKGDAVGDLGNGTASEQTKAAHGREVGQGATQPESGPIGRVSGRNGHMTTEVHVT